MRRLPRIAGQIGLFPSGRLQPRHTPPPRRWPGRHARANCGLLPRLPQPFGNRDTRPASAAGFDRVNADGPVDRRSIRRYAAAGSWYGPTNDLQRLLVQDPIARQHVRLFDVELAVPGGQFAAGFCKDRHEGAEIPRVNAVFDHDFAGALCDHEESVEIAEATLAFGLPHEVQKLLFASRFLEPGDARIVNVRLGERIDIGDVY